MAGVWRVLPGGQREYSDLVQGGQFVDLVEVTFELVGSGQVGTVKLLKRDYTEDRVRQLIDERARAMVAIEGLEG